MFRWYKDIKCILDEENETWLTYLHGKQLHNQKFYTKVKPPHSGLFLQIVKFLYVLFLDTRFAKKNRSLHPSTFFSFVGSANQLASLEQTLASIERSGERSLVVLNRTVLSEKEREQRGYITLQLSPLEAVRVAVLLFRRGIGLYRMVKAIHPVSVRWHFIYFCNVYKYLVYFHSAFSQNKPEFVITANDHSVPNRCMLAVAHHLGIKTVYLQHASVSNIFPALRVNYAFLDGQSALDTYRECELNQPSTFRRAPIPDVILSGQKKHLKRVKKSLTNILGIALNALDDAALGIAFINELAEHGMNVRLRWHPALSNQEKQQFHDAFSKSSKVTLSDPKQEPISTFMEQISWLIAGNSSIHLEAALAGVMPIYYELMDPDQPDYYGYVKHGLALTASSVNEVLMLMDRVKQDERSNKNAVRYYSATYLTEWDGKEGQLVADCLMKISEGVQPEELPGYVGFYDNK
ncbi:hypothetical protein [Methylophaga sp. OBS3]|uniref:hypothetical protein n=1 Tax=Methylophaga sp. OBS3 TaxID=2991934 RepID=UPI00224DF254|nr:hypothetical protein [Methylophaga sp. OBS3]MCX4190247.1 hypothetical protein [Methylophaga sp. OBS3]